MSEPFTFPRKKIKQNKDYPTNQNKKPTVESNLILILIIQPDSNFNFANGGRGGGCKHHRSHDTGY